MLVVFWFAGPAVVAALFALVAWIRWRNAYVPFALGIALALAYVAAAYVTAPPDYLHSHGQSDGELFLGRWWEPGFTVFVAVVGYASWAVGAVAGLAAGAMLRTSRPGSKQARQRAS